jgi:uncharacterized protein YkwD
MGTFAGLVTGRAFFRRGIGGILLSCLSLVTAGQVDAQDVVFRRKAAALFSVQPNIKSCQAGELESLEKQHALDAVNVIRSLHGLPPVRYDNGSEDEVVQISLMIAANEQISHMPSPFWKCDTVSGYEGAQSSNLYGGASPYLSLESSDQIVVGWLTDVHNIVANNVGHRRFLLNPFLDKIAFGRVAGIVDGDSVDGAAMKINYPPEGQGTDFTGEFVSYPFHDYPAKYYSGASLLSFAAVVSRSSALANMDVDYSAATVTIDKRGGGALAVTNVSYDNSGYGLPNNIQFAAGPLDPGTIYDVSIRGVIAGGVSRDYSYWFRIVP